MRLVYHQAHPGNFGDDLNAWLFPELLPKGFFDDDEAVLFYGIGTVLARKMRRRRSRKIIFGSGAGYKPPPALDDSYHVFFVRGPLTARALNLDPSRAISDPAYLIRDTAYARQEVKPEVEASVIPHYLSMGMLDWESVSRTTGLQLIDPSEHWRNVVNQIRRSRLVVTESLHGAILADAFRIRWVPVRFSYRFLDFKWIDWCQSIGVAFAPVDLPPAFQGSLRARKRAVNFLRNQLARTGLGPASWTRRPYRKSSDKELDALASVLRHTASTHRGFLSDDAVFESILVQLRRQLELLQKTFPD
ncbi:MAG: polysaccharide pyruvyl transferase family protein [Verrucomicrobiia bacterium]|jgi:succinoglycan biosynthesis protein ExoV